MLPVLLVEDKESLARMLREALSGEGLESEWAGSAEQALKLTARRRFGLVITDLKLPGADGLAVLREMRERDPDCPVIVMTGFGTVESAVEAMKGGAYDFIQKPIDIDRFMILLRRALEVRRLRTENFLLRDEFEERLGMPQIVGESAALGEVSSQIQKVAPTDSTVLVLGESGTGKELFARAIHHLSSRRDRPFVAVNCAAIPDTLIENELFGHERGAYTGAVGRGIGRFELADTGTIFLDEIGDLGPAVQSKILRVVQERAFERVGGTGTINVDVRIICATNSDLRENVTTGRFREDLFFRINVFPVTVPPLRARREDIPLLAAHFVNRFAREMGRQPIRIDPTAMDKLRSHHWPGNVRELANCLERAVILCEGGVIALDNLSVVTSPGGADDALGSILDLEGTLAQATDRTVRIVERWKIEGALRRNTTRSAAAAELGISAKALSNRIRDLDLEGKGTIE